MHWHVSRERPAICSLPHPDKERKACRRPTLRRVRDHPTLRRWLYKQIPSLPRPDCSKWRSAIECEAYGTNLLAEAISEFLLADARSCDARRSVGLFDVGDFDVAHRQRNYCTRPLVSSRAQITPPPAAAPCPGAIFAKAETKPSACFKSEHSEYPE
jgi:hypothetical protein